MGMMFQYTLAQCRDWELCRLDPQVLYETTSPRVITKEDPDHWHLHQWEGGDWVTKTRWGCLNKLVSLVNENYDRLYDEEGVHRS